MVGANKFRLGVFVLLGVVLFLGTVFFLGLSDIFTKKARLVTLFQESVQGLAVGSQVKYKGVPIGSVDKIIIQTDDKLIRVDMQVDPSIFGAGREFSAEDIEETFYKFFKSEREIGLRCRLEYAGITGLKYVELDYFDDVSKNPVLPKPTIIGNRCFYIPSTPSAFKDILKLINHSLESISKIKYEEISNATAGALNEMKRLLQDPKLVQAIHTMERMSTNLEKSSAALNKVLTEDKIREIVARMEDVLKSLDNLARQVNKQVESARLDETATSFRSAAQAVGETRQMLTHTLTKMNQALDSITELANYLGEDPSSILRGKNAPQVKFPNN